MRRGKESQWLDNTGQWLALGVGVGSFFESVWYLVKAVHREVSLGKPYCEDLRYLGGDAVYTSDTGSDEVPLVERPHAYPPAVYQQSYYSGGWRERRK